MRYSFSTSSKQDAEILLHAQDMMCVLWDLLFNKLHDMADSDELTTAEDAINAIRHHVVSQLEDYGIDLDRLD